MRSPSDHLVDQDPDLLDDDNESSEDPLEDRVVLDAALIPLMSAMKAHSLTVTTMMHQSLGPPPNGMTSMAPTQRSQSPGSRVAHRSSKIGALSHSFSLAGTGAPSLAKKALAQATWCWSSEAQSMQSRLPEAKSRKSLADWTRMTSGVRSRSTD